MTNEKKKIGLVLFDKSGLKALDRCPADTRVYVYHPSFGEDDSVLFTPQHEGIVIRRGPPFDWLVEHLQGKVGDDALDFVRMPQRKNVAAELLELREAGLIGPHTRIEKGF